MTDDVFKARGENGPGYSECSCGERSPVLPSAARREAWLQEHKASMASVPSPTER